MILTVAEQVLQTVKVVAGVIQIAACQRALHQQAQTLQLLLRLIGGEHVDPMTGGAFGFVQSGPCPQQLGADAQQELVHRQLFQVLIADQGEGFLLGLPGGLQEALGKQNFALLDQAPQGVVPNVMAARHLLRLLHQRQGAGEIAFTVQHFAVHRGGDDAAVEVRQRQLLQRSQGQALGLFRVAVVDGHLRA